MIIIFVVINIRINVKVLEMYVTEEDEVTIIVLLQCYLKEFLIL